MNERNVYDELREELESKFTKEKEEHLKTKIQGTVGSLSFVADILELFFTKLLKVLLGTGANEIEKK